ncbi:putative DNA-directed rna polymerase I largest subunit [Trypanosoma conorhini]|uniref:DNA-directed RNA polymerase n=1 Tax=Trypanosoma conorhini TaxID=83891 RepID=A0A3R7LHP6_9TRYP|nr:putative DNA-directed rna polymerase I largest subunit [Trypanosoma conorhini]RNF27472.1 putative DNA-directed rna polymerase I largest subunit [Trypanosoma conorhini]
MSLITAFPFHAYVGDLKTRRVMPEKVAVSLSLLTPDDMARMAFVEVRTRCGQEEKTAPWRPVTRNGEEHATFYDLRMGNFDVRTFPPHSCQTCAASLTGKYGNERCQGHFGFIGMPRLHPGDALQREVRLFVMNPHLVQEVEQLLQAKCFFCHRFRAPLFDVERYRQALRLIDRGLIGEALHLLDVVSNARGYDMRHRRLHTANEEVVNDVTLLEEHTERILQRCAPASASEKEPASHEATARRGAIDVRNGIVRQALRELKEYVGVCSHCNGISPRITKQNGHFFFFFTRNSATVNVANALLSQAQLREWEENNKLHGRTRTYFRSQDIREHLRQLCHCEELLLGMLFPHLGEPSVSTAHATPLPAREMYKAFFIDRILVPPLPLRLSSGVQVQDSGAISPDAQTRALSDILGFVEQIECYQVLRDNSTPDRSLVSTAQEVANEVNLRNLQAKVNEVYQDIMGTFAKKEGLFRMHMMGKRVNQACRSVISPDLLVEPNEVLLPRPFARSLSFPEQVTCYAPARMSLLKRCVINGPRRYPGATHLELRHTNGEIRFIELDVPEQTRRQHAAKYFALAQSGVTLIVYRHILDGDRVVFNRQPTLHKASMMGYRVKVLSGHKTLRFHYVNGSSFNADFDGDEMNIHVPQSLEAKAELDGLMDANLNYLVPTSGKPIRGLIQDHVAAGVMLTLRDKFLEHATFVQLAYYGLAPYLRQQHDVTLSDLIPVPAILRPRPLWTGKQLISVVIRYVSGVGRRPTWMRVNDGGACLRGTSLIQPSVYNHTLPGCAVVQTVTRQTMDDDALLFMNSELLMGLMCKKQLGASSMSIAHVVHELYGPHKVGQLFGALGRILSQSLQREGFSIGMDDMFLVHEERRYQLLRQLDEAPLHLPDDEAAAMTKIMECATKLQQEFIPGRMMVPFPRNHLLMMTTSGAKGSNANATQMALGLGQQLFDGRRVRRMNSAKTLPAFFAHERRARSFGYAIGRFASGIRPPEYTIHAMAGRDGLIDTAVKTSRSGHLQRCLIKGLESLVVHWDHSVRDSNGSIVQFTYGGDGLDPCKASTLTSWEMAKENLTDFGKRFGVDTGEAGPGDEAGTATRVQRGKRPRTSPNLPSRRSNKNTNNINNSNNSNLDDDDDDDDDDNDGDEHTRHSNRNSNHNHEQARQLHREQQLRENPLPRHMHDSLEDYLRTKATFPLFQRVSQLARWRAQGRVQEKLAEKRGENIAYYRDVLSELATSRRVRAFCDPGEPVGLLAAQAAGEPSTQMTLNTFHSAGSTVTHVTEGIPRLRELLIHAAVQKAAVIVPVEKATPADEAAIARILRAGLAIRLRDCLARGGAGGKGYHYHVARGKEASVVTLAMLFSHSRLDDSRARMCMSPSEHLQSFTEALRQFAKRIIKSLSGRTREEKDGGDAAAMVSNQHDPMDAAAAAAAADSEDNDGSEGGCGLDKDEALSEYASDATNSAAVGGVSPAHRSQRSGTDAPDAFENGNDDEDNEEEGDDDDDEAAGNAEEGTTGRGDAAGRSLRGQHGRKRRAPEADEDVEDEEEEDGGGMRSSAAAQGAVSYDSFAPLHAALGGKEFVLDVAPLSRLAAERDGVAALPDDLFVVNVVVRMPPHIIAVIPDVVDGALEQQTLPSWLPQFAAVTFTRKADDATSGELLFQGANATMRHVLSFVSLFNLGARAIKLRQARSTDIRDMANWLGVESAYRALYDELSKLFKRYSVDHRHLTLIADAATHRGMWENFNFTGVISQSASPLFQMTFASSRRWLHTAVSRGLSDELQSISSAIMVGERPRVGTACVRVTPDAAVLRDVLEHSFE